jgi:hypothetical protein
MREDGVELSTSEKLDDMVPNDDDSRRLHKVRIDGNGEQLVHAWLDAQPAETTLAISTALRQFNEDKEPALTEHVFRSYLRSYLEGSHEHELEFSSDTQRIRLKVPF